MARKRRTKHSVLLLEMKEAGLRPSREIAFIVIFDLFIIVLGYLSYRYTKEVWGTISLGFMMAAFDYILLQKRKRIIEKHKTDLEHEFVHIFSYFSIFIKNKKPIYNALEDVVKYSSYEMGAKLKKLISEIDKDKSVAPFKNFGQSFDNLEIRQVMISIYRISFEGNSESYLRQFETIFEKLASSKQKSRIENERSRFSNYNFLPLLASAFSMGIVAVSIVILMENYANVI